MTPEVNWFYVWGGIVVLIILGIGAYTYKEIARTNNKHNRRGTIDENSVLAVLRAQADGALYGLLEADTLEIAALTPKMPAMKLRLLPVPLCCGPQFSPAQLYSWRTSLISLSLPSAANWM